MAMSSNDSLKSRSLSYHEEPVPGKISVVSSKPCETQLDLSLAYTPGVAEPCLAIKDVLGSLLTTLKRARYNCGQGDGCETVSGESCLVASDLVEAHADCPPSQHAGGICGGAAMPHEENCRHSVSLTKGCGRCGDRRSSPPNRR